MINNLGNKNHYIRYVRVSEFEMDFPLVYLCDGKISFSLMCFTKEQISKGRGKDAALRKVFSVVAEVYQFYMANERKHTIYLERGHELFVDCFSAKLNGTIMDGDCDYGLFWKKSKYQNVINGVNSFSKYQSYCKRYHDVIEIYSDDAISEMTIKYNRFTSKTGFNLLSHLETVEISKYNDCNQTSLVYGSLDKCYGYNNLIKYFPPDKIKNFIDDERNVNYKAAYLLSAFTGLRESENLHIFVTDIIYKANTVEVILSDPNVGYTFSAEKNKLVPRSDILESCRKKHKSTSDLDQTNNDYLSRLPVRTLLNINHRYFLGWKGVQLSTSNQKYGYLIEWTNGYAQDLFTQLVPKLLKQNRRGHPYLLCNEATGMPMTLDAYESRFRRHSKKVTGKDLYPHVMRHFTGFYCANVLHLNLEDIKRILRHKSTTSTQKYYNLSQEEIKRKIGRKETSIWNDLNFNSWEIRNEFR